MKKQFLCISLFLLFVSCTTNMKFDQLFLKQEYKQAYELLRKRNSTKNSPQYKSRELKAVLALVINGHTEYLSILEALLSTPQEYQMNNWVMFARAWIRFISATKTEEFANVLEILPSQKFEDPHIELLRLSIQSHSLLKLEQYQILLMHLKESKLSQKSSDLLYLQAVSYLKIKDTKQSEKNFKKVLEMTENERLKSLSYFYLGEIQQQLNNDEKAFEYYLLSWELEPYNSETNFRIGTLLQKKSTDSLHTRFFKSALRLNENIAAAWLALNLQ
ncbi:MAG: tetratricopeptide repeat protein [Brevinema sp.]